MSWFTDSPTSSPGSFGRWRNEPATVTYPGKRRCDVIADRSSMSSPQSDNRGNSMATDSTQSGPVTDPSQEDYDKKTHRHRLMLSNISKTLVETSNFLDGAVQDVAQQLADGLQAECVCIFFRLKATKALKRYGLG